MVVDLLAEGPVELALAGAPGDPGREALALEVGRTFVPNRIVAPCDPAQPTPDLPLTFGKSLVGGRAALYVCKNFACAAPIVEPAEVRPLLAPPAAPETQAPAGGALPGRATAQATLAHTARVAPHGRAPLGSTGLTVSKLGFGCYRVGEGDPEHAEALAMALGRGCNLIDTSTNYGDGGSERVVGEVLGELVRARSIDRAAVVVVSKIGYVQGQNMRLARQREGSGRPFPEMVKYADGCWHCMHPEFLADQLQRSLQRLGLATLDVCLIHNPEYFFSDAVHHGRTDVAAVRDEFYGRLANAFEYFEREVAAGRLGCYGVSSNSAAMPISDAEETSLERMLDAAQRAGGDGHHFRVLQLPFNLIESGAALEKKHAGKSPLELAAARGIAVLANRPLNAIRGRGMVRLADPGLGSEGIDDARQRQTRAWAGEALDPALPEARRTESLSRRALWVLASTPGLSSVLLGMRRPPHVEDAMAVLSWEPLQEPLSALGRL
jgi:aryl-alcohol dehydrogenase-like predicted oxidoreductase